MAQQYCKVNLSTIKYFDTQSTTQSWNEKGPYSVTVFKIHVDFFFQVRPTLPKKLPRQSKLEIKILYTYDLCPNTASPTNRSVQPSLLKGNFQTFTQETIIIMHSKKPRVPVTSNFRRHTFSPLGPGSPGKPIYSEKHEQVTYKYRNLWRKLP